MSTQPDELHGAAEKKRQSHQKEPLTRQPEDRRQGQGSPHRRCEHSFHAGEPDLLTCRRRETLQMPEDARLATEGDEGVLSVR